MIIFSNRAAAHLINKIELPKADYTIKQFSDGEVYLKINQDVRNQDIWVVACTQPPAENLLELFLLLDTLTRAGAHKINLFFPYFGYARQAKPSPGEVSSAQFICNTLKQFSLGKIYIMHAHAASTLKSFLNFTNVIDMDYFCQVASNYDMVVASDQGGAEFAQHVSKQCNKEIVYLQKTRPSHEQVIIKSVDGNVAGKKILLVDDIIATGRTLVEAAQALKNLGAQQISAAATHGIFSDGAYERLENSPLEKVYITNTIRDSYNKIIQVYNIAPFIEEIIKKESKS